VEKNKIMGIFDTIKCHRVMPEPDDDSCEIDFNSLTYQTKSLNGLMDNYRITSNGFLEVERGGTSFSSKYGSDGRFEVIEESCTIEFYTTEEGYWIEYIATFNNGKMTQLELKDYKLQQFGKWERA
jgi:hypothetical protein